MERIILIVFGLLGSISIVNAQFSVEGIIKDENDAPLSYANIMLYSMDSVLIKGEVADGDGSFILKSVVKDDYILHVSAIGYAVMFKKIKVSTSVSLGVLNLEVSAVQMDEVMVTADKVAFERKPDRMIVNVSSLPSASGTNAFELLSKLPTVVANPLNGNIKLLGRSDVVVFINGKRSRLDGTELIQYLESIPASSIENVELINNPPASFDADGTGGVINIVLNRNLSDRTNLSLTTFGGYGERLKYGISSSVNANLSRIQLYGDGSFSTDYTFQNFTIESAIGFNDQLFTTDQESIRPALIENYSAKLGLIYPLNPNTSIDIFGNYTQRVWELEAETRTKYGGLENDVDNDLLFANEVNDGFNYNVSAKLQHAFSSKSKLAFDYDYLFLELGNPTEYELRNFNREGKLINTSGFETSKETPFTFHAGKVDYTYTTPKELKWSAGLKGTLSGVKNETAFVNENGESSDDIFTDNIIISDDIFATYISIEGPLSKRLTFNTGLRYEHSEMELNALRDNISRRISKIFPSISLTNRFSDVGQLIFSYRERITRPPFRILAPAFFFLNPNTALAGNIQVLPNINRTAEIAFNHNSFFVSLSYSKDDQPIVPVPILEPDQNLLLLIWDNIESREQIGINMGFPILIASWWNSRNNITSFWRRDKIQIFDEQRTVSEPYVSIDISQEFSFPGKWTLELTGRYESVAYLGTIKNPQRTSVNFGIRKKFSQSIIGLSWSDIFNSGSFFGWINDLPRHQIFYNWNYNFEGSIIKLSYTHRLGNDKALQTRKSEATEVLNRVN